MTWLRTSSFVAPRLTAGADDQHGGDDRQPARDQPPQPGASRRSRKSLHHDLPGERPRDGRVLARGEQRHAEHDARRARPASGEQAIGLVDLGDIGASGDMEGGGGDDQDRRVDEEGEEDSATVLSIVAILIASRLRSPDWSKARVCTTEECR